MQKSYRIALASDWFLPRLGGIELHLAGLSHALAAIGHRSDILTTTPGPAICDGIAVTRIPSLRIHGLDVAVSPKLVARLKDALAAGGFDIVHAHFSVVSPTSLAAILAARALGLPVVVTGHSMLLHAVAGFRLLDRLTGWSAWPILLTAVSSLVAQQGRNAARGREVLVLPNGVDLGFWAGARPAAATAREPKSELLVASAMRLNPKKRPRELVRAFAEAVTAVEAQGRRIHLTIAGDGPERRRIEADVRKLGLGGKVSLPGTMSRSELARLYAKADIFALPSIREAFGLAALEARCAGLPVVTMQGSGAVDFMQDGVTGLFATDDRMLAGHLTRLALDDTLRHRLAAPDAGLARFDWPAVADAHIACYERAIALIGDVHAAPQPAR